MHLVEGPLLPLPTGQSRTISSRDEAIEELIAFNYKLINDAARGTANPTKLWQRYLIEFLKKGFFDLTCGQSFKNQSGHFPFTLCLTGSNAKGLGTPLCDIDIFIIAENEADVPNMQRAMIDLKKLLSDIAEKSDNQFMQVDPIGLDPVRLCGTQQQLLNIMRERDFATYTTSFLSAKSICGNHRLLFDFQNRLKSITITSESGKLFSSISSYYYYAAAYDFTGPHNKDKINIKRDILRPVTFMLDALKFEFHLDNSDNITDPHEIIALLEENGHISSSVAALFEFVFNKLINIRWFNHVRSLRESDTIQLDEFNRHDIRELIDAVAILRGIAQKKVIDNGRTVALAANESQAFQVNLNSINLPYSDSVYSKDDKAIDVRQISNHHSELFFSKQREQFVKNIRNNVDPSRIFNSLKSPMNYTGFEGMFLNTIDSRTCKINQDKFNVWLWSMIKDFAILDLFDESGHIKQYLVDLFNKDNWYESKIDKNVLTKQILYSFLMNLIYVNRLADNKRYSELSANSHDIEHPEDHLVQQLKKYFNEFFNQYIFPESVKLTDIINPQQLNLHLIRLLEADKTDLNSLRLFLGHEKLINLVAYLLAQGDRYITVLEKHILEVIHNENLSVSAIAQQFGAHNCDKLLRHYINLFDIEDNEDLLASVILTAFSGDKSCKSFLQKIIATTNYNSQKIKTLINIVEQKLRAGEFSVGIIQDLGNDIFRKIATYVFSLPEAGSFLFAQQIVKKINQTDLSYELIDVFYGLANRNKILTLYFQLFSIFNKPNLLHSVITSAFQNDSFSQRLLNDLAINKNTGDYVISSLAQYVVVPTCQVTVSQLRQSLSAEVFTKVITHCFDPKAMPAGNRICQQILTLSDTQSRTDILLLVISILIKQSKITIEQVKQTLGNDIFLQLVTAVFRLVNAHENPLAQKIIQQILWQQFTYTQIVEHFDAANIENILNCYFKINTEPTAALSSSMINRALANDNYCLERVKAQFSTAQSQMVGIIAIQLVNELNAGKSLEEITALLGKDMVNKIIAHILKKQLAAENPVITKIFAQITDANLSLQSIDEKFGAENRDGLLHYYFKNMKASFNWPENTASIAREIVCNLVLEGHLEIGTLLKLTKQQLDRLKENCYTKYFEFNPERAIEVLPIYLNPEVQNYHLILLRNEGLITPEVYNETDHISVEYAAYKTFVHHVDWNVDVVTRSAQMQKLEQLLANKHFKAIKKHVLEPIDQEIDRLNNDRGNLCNVDGVDKAIQMVDAKVEIKNLIIHNVNAVVTGKILRNDPVPNTDMPQLLNSVVNKVEDIAQRDEIAGRRNKVGAFFKGLLGVLLAVPLLFIPFFSRDYRDAFFKSESVQRLNSIRDNLEDRKLLSIATPARGR